jgi:adenylate cyclase
MQREIERKFLVKNEDFLGEPGLDRILEITQGYLSKSDGRIVRVRRVHDISDDFKYGQLTIKIKTIDDKNAGVDEFEYDIPYNEAARLLEHCLDQSVRKTRHVIYYNSTKWEVDVFHDQKNGLILAEVELQNIIDKIEIPSWVGDEVTGLAQYFNAKM